MVEIIRLAELSGLKHQLTGGRPALGRRARKQGSLARLTTHLSSITRVRWSHGKHNASPAVTVFPRSLAIDLGRAQWPAPFSNTRELVQDLEHGGPRIPSRCSRRIVCPAATDWRIGHLKRPELTAERFVRESVSKQVGVLLSAPGTLSRWGRGHFRIPRAHGTTRLRFVAIRTRVLGRLAEHF
jgi:hypothetical protein